MSAGSRVVEVVWKDMVLKDATSRMESDWMWKLVGLAKRIRLGKRRVSSEAFETELLSPTLRTLPSPKKGPVWSWSTRTGVVSCVLFRLAPLSPSSTCEVD